MLTQRVNDLENQNNAYAEQVERQQEQMEELEREWTAKNLQLQNSIDTFQQRSQQTEVEEDRRAKQLRQDYKQLKKDYDSLNKKLEKTEDYLRVSKELSTNLQKEKCA